MKKDPIYFSFTFFYDLVKPQILIIEEQKNIWLTSCEFNLIEQLSPLNGVI